MRSLLILFLLSAPVSALAAPDNSNGEKFEFLHAEIMDLRDAINDLSIDSATTSQSIESLESDIEDLSDQLNDLQSQIDTLGTSDHRSSSKVLGYANLNEKICVADICRIDEILKACLMDFGSDSYTASFRQFREGINTVPYPEEDIVVFGINESINAFTDNDPYKSRPYWYVSSRATEPANTRTIRPNPRYYVACVGPEAN